MAENSKRVLVTGSTGLLGSSFLRKLSTTNLEVYSPLRSDLDLRDTEMTRDFLAEASPSFVIHCGAKVGGIQANLDSPADFILENMRIDTSLLTAARELKIPNLIYFGSSCMYPRNAIQPMKEEAILSGPLEPSNEGYALAKICASRVVQEVSKQDKLNWRVLILSNLYGPHDNFDLSNSHLIAAVIAKTHEAILDNEDSVTVWGSGLARREFTYVDDVSEFVVDNLTRMHKWDCLMNIGVGEDYTINTYYKIVAEIMGFKGRLINNSELPDGMPQKIMDSSRALRHNWSPRTSLKEGLVKTINWYLEMIRK